MVSFPNESHEDVSLMVHVLNLYDTNDFKTGGDHSEMNHDPQAKHNHLLDAQQLGAIVYV